MFLLRNKKKIFQNFPQNPTFCGAVGVYCVISEFEITVKILKFGTPQTIAIIVLKIEKFDVTLH